MNKVALVKAGKDIITSVTKCVDLLGGLGIKKGKQAVIKPNLCNAKNPYGMVNTDFRIIEAIVELLKSETNKIIVVESDNVSDIIANRALKSGLTQKLDELGVELINLSEDDYEIHEIAGKKLRLPKTILEADYFVNLPKIKTEGHVTVTLSIKNLFGIPQRRKKNKLHSTLNEILPYIAGVVKNDLIVVDGIVAMEGNGPIIGTPVNLGVIVAGRNLVSVDAICCALMGINPNHVSHLSKSHKKGLGEIDPNAIKVIGENWKEFSRKFEKPYSFKASIKSIKSIRKIYLPI